MGAENVTIFVKISVYLDNINLCPCFPFQSNYYMIFIVDKSTTQFLSNI